MSLKIHNGVLNLQKAKHILFFLEIPMLFTGNHDWMNHNDLLALCNNFAAIPNRRIMDRYLRSQGIFTTLLPYKAYNTRLIEHQLMEVLIRTQLN